MTDTPQSDATEKTFMEGLFGEVSPKFVSVTDDVIYGDVWTRTDLSPRDRSLMVIAAFIAGGNGADLEGYFAFAKANGVTETEIKEAILHIAFYAGWPKAVPAMTLAKRVFTEPTEPAIDGQNNVRVADPNTPSDMQKLFGTVAPKLVALTDDVLFGDIWARPELSLRDRSLLTIAGLIAGGNTEQLNWHIPYGRKNGLTETEITETITQLAFYAGWPRAVSAMTVAKRVFDAEKEGER